MLAFLKVLSLSHIDVSVSSTLSAERLISNTMASCEPALMTVVPLGRTSSTVGT